jgi:radical SAM superfamily enzyme YgiQ (UPF0313 family)
MKNAGHSVDLIQDEIDNAEEYLSNHHVDFVFYSVMTSEFPWYLKRNKELKQKFNFISIFGGPHFTFYPEEGIDDPHIDFIVRGPGEYVINDILSGKIKDKVTMGIIPNLSELPHPDRTILYKYPYFGKANIKRFMACRDCFHSCKFCASKMYREIFQDQKCSFYQITDVDFLLDEIEDVRKTYGLEFVYFNDDDLAGHKEWFKEFLEKYTERINLPWGCEIRATSVTKEIVKNMKLSNCSTVFIGLESANPETLKLLGRTVSVEQVEKVCYWCEEYGIRVSLENIIALPLEDPLKDALETLAFNIKMPQVHSWCALYQPFPHTELWKYCIDNGYYKPSKYTKFFLFEDTSPLNIKNKTELSRLQKWWYYIVKYKLPMEFVPTLMNQELSPEFAEQLNKHRYEMSGKELYSV